jgi:hypothetical protein
VQKFIEPAPVDRGIPCAGLMVPDRSFYCRGQVQKQASSANAFVIGLSTKSSILRQLLQKCLGFFQVLSIKPSLNHP